MQKEWKVKKDDTSREKMPAFVHPAIYRLLFQRGVFSEGEIEKFFNPDYDRDLGDFENIAGMKEAVGRIVSAKNNQEKICIFGDYDADGVTATALLYDTFRFLGFSDICYYIPDRQSEGYGMNLPAVRQLAREGVKLIITVDCGITGYDETREAKNLGMDVIVTDHHHVSQKIPEAATVINPNLENSGFSFSHLAGVGVAFKLAQGIFQRIGPEKSEQLKWMLDLVMIGTVADCVPLLGENRVLVKYGLIVLSKTRRVGLQEMFRVGGIAVSSDSVPSAHQVAFQIAPRINASGRMDHAGVSYNLIIEEDRARARALALEVEAKNQERQKITSQIFREISVLAENSFKDKKFIFCHNSSWPVGILGLVAGKAMEEFQKPTAVLQDQGEVLTGSFRSVPEFNIIQALEKCSDLLLRFGGHSQAAGVTIKKENLEDFYARLSLLAEEALKDKKDVRVIEIDLEISPEDIDWDLVSQIRKMEPFGNGNPEPVFLARGFRVVESKVVGNGNKHLKLGLRPGEKSPKVLDSIGFSLGEAFGDISPGDKVDAVFSLSEDEWNGNKKIQLKLIDLKKG